MTEEPVTLEGIGREIRRIQCDVADMRDEALVHGAILRRVETAVITLVDEIRAMQSQHARLVRRVETVEDRLP
jgi:hypothetical protein